jgi:hypothetical protein
MIMEKINLIFLCFTKNYQEVQMEDAMSETCRRRAGVVKSLKLRAKTLKNVK